MSQRDQFLFCAFTLFFFGLFSDCFVMSPLNATSECEYSISSAFTAARHNPPIHMLHPWLVCSPSEPKIPASLLLVVSNGQPMFQEARCVRIRPAFNDATAAWCAFIRGTEQARSSSNTPNCLPISAPVFSRRRLGVCSRVPNFARCRSPHV